MATNEQSAQRMRDLKALRRVLQDTRRTLEDYEDKVASNDMEAAVFGEMRTHYKEREGALQRAIGSLIHEDSIS